MYACLTCTPEARSDPKKRAGVCLACSYSCHEGHEMVELYTKRDFRCDCGTMKILAVKCRLDTVKLEQNDANKYNQNFSGVYCFCHRPYPDPEDPIDDEMIQCVVCEDWYHCRHLQATVPNLNEFSEMICGTCMTENSFLHNYTDLSVVADDAEDDVESANVTIDDVASANVTAVDVDIADTSVVAQIDSDEKLKENKPDEKEEENITDEQIPQKDDDKVDEQLTDEINQCIMDIIEINKSNGESTSDETSNNVVPSDSPPAKRQKLNDASDTSIPKPTVIVATSSAASQDTSTQVVCKKPSCGKAKLKGATFWRHDWRYKLCDCLDCVAMMKELKVEFLLDQEDTVLCYQEKGLAKGKQPAICDQRIQAALSNLGRTQQIDVIMGYNNLKDKLGEFLSAFVTSQQVVTVEDVNRFFRMMKDKHNAA